MSPTTSRVIRRTHMYLALFLAPWMIVYALSGIVINHGLVARGLFGGKPATFEKIEERAYPTAFSDDADPRMIGAQILDDLGLSGTFNVQGKAGDPKLVINRNGGFAQHRITFFRGEKRLLVEKLAFTAPVFFNRAHFRHGYEQPFLSAKIWGATVDLAIVGMVFWVLSGLIMWWEIKPARVAGAVFALVGFGLLGVFFATI